MQTLDHVRFFPLAHLNGTLIGLDRRWIEARGLLMLALVALVAPAGLLSPNPSLPVWLKLGASVSAIFAMLLASLAHELGHAVAGWLAGLPVRAVVLAPEGGMTIRASSGRPLVNVCTALAGPLANALVGLAFAALAWQLPETPASLLWQVTAIQLVAGLVNLLPIGRFDGAHVLAALTSSRAHAHVEQGSRTLNTST